MKDDAIRAAAELLVAAYEEHQKTPLPPAQRDTLTIELTEHRRAIIARARKVLGQ